MQESDFHRLAIETAALSQAKKRKVGAVAVGTTTNGQAVYCASPNYHPDGKSCELQDGSTDPAVVHAEVAALAGFRETYQAEPVTMYVTQPPCGDCVQAVAEVKCRVVVVEEFMKFDTEKLRYDLVPTSAIEGLARVITYGARKYKPDNWRKGDIERYEAAAFRHLMAWRQGEECDEESGLTHLTHLLCNIAFMIELDNNKSE